MASISFIDTHAHLDGEEFAADRDDVVRRAREAGCSAIFLPAIDAASCRSVLEVCDRYAGFCFPMLGLHPEEVKPDWSDQLTAIGALLRQAAEEGGARRPIAIGEVGLDYYWSREYEHEQLEAFEQQVEWSIETRLPLMIHCRKAQNEMVRLLRGCERELPGGVFHCFTGNAHEAVELLQFERFALGIGGVSTFKKSHLPEVLPSVVPLDRLVLETDAPYMAPVPMRGQRNESAFVAFVIEKLAGSYGVTPEELARTTTETVRRIFPLAFANRLQRIKEI